MAESENTTEKSRTLILTAFGGHDKIKVVEKARPKPGAGQVLVNIEACGVNFANLTARQGVSKHPPIPPCELGMEGSGVIAEIGEGVTTFQVRTMFDLFSGTVGGRVPGHGRGVCQQPPRKYALRTKGKVRLQRSDRLVASRGG